MLKQIIILITAFLFGVIACVYVLAISNSSTSMAPNDAWTAASKKVAELRGAELPVTTNVPEPTVISSPLDKAQASAQTLVVHPKEFDTQSVEQADAVVATSTQTDLQTGKVDEESLRVAEKVHLKDRQLKTISPELLPPAEDVRFHQEIEAALMSNINKEPAIKNSEVSEQVVERFDEPHLAPIN